MRVEVASDSPREPQAVERVWGNDSWRGADQHITLQDTTQRAEVRAAANVPTGQLARCVPTLPGDDTYPQAWTVIGRLNPNRGTTGSFSYGREHTNEISFSLNAAYEALAIGGGSMIGTRRTVSQTNFKRGKGRYRVLAYVRYHRELLRYDRGAKKDQLCTPKAVITPDRVYETGLRTDSRIRDTAKVGYGDCRNSRIFRDDHRSEQEPGTEFERGEGRIGATKRGVTVAGIGLDTQSGLTENVKVAYRFGFRKRRYLLCGIGGQVDPGGQPRPSSWTQLWAGA